MTLWLDDVREPWRFGHVGALWAKTAEEAIEMLEAKRDQITFVSLDHDLVPVHYTRQDRLLYEQGEKGTGKEVANWIAQSGWWPERGVCVHSMNPVGAQYMMDTLARVAAGPLIRRIASVAH